MNPWYKDGLSFTCTQCSACCRHDPGYVFMSQHDLDRLCEHTKLSHDEFRKKYTRIVGFGFADRLSLTEKTNNDCIFWDQGCTVYEARPLQCRAFPFWSSLLGDKESWEEHTVHCPGMNQGKLHSKEDIDAWLDARLANPHLEA